MDALWEVDERNSSATMVTLRRLCESERCETWWWIQPELE